MNTTKAAQKAAINAAKLASEPFEALRSQVAKPLISEFGQELGAFFGSPHSLRRQPTSLAHEELKRARDQKELEEKSVEDKQKSEQLIASIHREYKMYENKVNAEQHQMKQEFSELQQEVATLAKTAGVETKAHLTNPAKKIGIMDIKFLTRIVRLLRLKAEESRSAQELTSQRQNAKRSTGMLAWVSGKQMKVHEQGTLQLQG